ncbi:MAG: Occludin/ELL family protein, partial [Synechococcus sp. Tobar2m-G35]|nr:Occludin/ELL family protein [Synechococcus sp. Tobar2m-G35]
QLTDLFGIAMGGGDGSRVMGLGFTDQTIVWDGSAVEATYRSLLDEQSAPLQLRVADRLEPVRGLW